MTVESRDRRRETTLGLATQVGRGEPIDYYKLLVVKFCFKNLQRERDFEGERVNGSISLVLRMSTETDEKLRL